MPLLPITVHPLPLRVLVTLDGSECAEAALEPTVQLLMSLAPGAPKELHLLRVVSLPATLMIGNVQGSTISDTITRVEKGAMDYIVAITHKLQQAIPEGSAIAITSMVAMESDVGGTIIKTAEAESKVGETGYRGYHLIAMATHGRSGMPRWVLGSVTERVLHGTSLPLFIVRPLAVAKAAESPDQSPVGEAKTAVESWPALF